MGTRGDRRRFLWSLLASAAINAFAWLAWSGNLTIRSSADRYQARETVAVSVSSLRMERRPPPPPPTPRPTLAPTTPAPALPPPPTPAPAPRRMTHAAHAKPKAAHASEEPVSGVVLAPPQPAALALPRGWTREDVGFAAVTDTATWVDFRQHAGSWVPRVFLWQRKMEARYMHRPSLQDTVEQILASLHEQDAKIYESKAARVCRGLRPGWFFSYVKTADDPPLHFDETIVMNGEIVYRATYIRAADQREDPEMRDALNTLCSD